MIIKESMVADRQIVGKTSNGDPVVMVTTHGGLYAFFTKSGDEIKTLGMAPHKAIAAWMSEKKMDSIKWNSDFMKSEKNEIANLKKSDEDLFSRLRKLLFGPGSNSSLKKTMVEKNDLTYEDHYIFYNMALKEIGILHKHEILENIKNRKYKTRLCVLRKLDLSEPPSFLNMYKGL